MHVTTCHMTHWQPPILSRDCCVVALLPAQGNAARRRRGAAGRVGRAGSEARPLQGVQTLASFSPADQQVPRVPRGQAGTSKAWSRRKTQKIRKACGGTSCPRFRRLGTGRGSPRRAGLVRCGSRSLACRPPARRKRPTTQQRSLPTSHFRAIRLRPCASRTPRHRLGRRCARWAIARPAHAPACGRRPRHYGDLPPPQQRNTLPFLEPLTPLHWRR